MEKQKVVLPSLRAFWVHESPPEPNPIFGPHRQAESRGVIKNLILVGTIIMLVALGQTRVSLPE